MSQGLPTTSYALLGLLTFGDELTGYELKQRADSTLRFYWVSPAMSQVYSELARLSDVGLVQASQATGGPTRYRITPEGRSRLQHWLADEPLDFPALKHPVALRLLLGHLMEPDAVAEMLEGYLDDLTQRRAELEGVHESLEASREAHPDPFRFPRVVAEWGLAYYDGEYAVIESLLARLRAHPL